MTVRVAPVTTDEQVETLSGFSDRASTAASNAAEQRQAIFDQQADLNKQLASDLLTDEERADLTKREFDLLAVLADNAGVVLTRQRLLELVWGYDFDVDTNVADVFISYLRRKLERDDRPRVIHTVRGIGYVLRSEAP